MIQPPHFSEDDFEFDEPSSTQRRFDLTSVVGQDEVIQHLGRMQGVQGVLISRVTGEILREKGIRETKSLAAVMAASGLLFGQGLKLISVSFSQQMVCMRSVKGYCITVLGGPQVNTGRLLVELQQLGITAP